MLARWFQRPATGKQQALGEHHRKSIIPDEFSECTHKPPTYVRSFCDVTGSEENSNVGFGVVEGTCDRANMLKMMHPMACPLCFCVMVPELFPRELSCGHVYCSDCIAQFPLFAVSNAASTEPCWQLNCVLCRQTTQVETVKGSAGSGEFDVRQLKPADRVSQEAHELCASVLTCGECDVNGTECYCDQCEEYLCKICSDRIHAGRGTSQHSVVQFHLDWDATGHYRATFRCKDCEEKNNKTRAGVMCRQCQYPLCFECGVSPAHRSHEMALVSEVAQGLQRKMRSLRKSLSTERTKIKIAHTLLDRHMKLLEHNHNSARAGLITRFGQIQALLQRAQETLLQDIDNQVQMKRAQLEDQREYLTKIDTDLYMQSQLARRCVKTTSTPFILEYGRTIITSMQDSLDSMPSLEAQAHIPVDVQYENLSRLLRSVSKELPLHIQVTAGVQLPVQANKKRNRDDDDAVMASPKRTRQSDITEGHRRVSSNVDDDEWKRRVLEVYLEKPFESLLTKQWKDIYYGHHNILVDRGTRSTIPSNTIKLSIGDLSGLPLSCVAANAKSDMYFDNDSLLIVDGNHKTITCISRQDPSKKSISALEVDLDRKQLAPRFDTVRFLKRFRSEFETMVSSHFDGLLRLWSRSSIDPSKFSCFLTLPSRADFIDGTDACFAATTVQADTVTIWKFPSGDVKEVNVRASHPELNDAICGGLVRCHQGFIVSFDGGRHVLMGEDGVIMHVFNEPEDALVLARREQVSLGSPRAHVQTSATSTPTTNRPFSPRQFDVGGDTCLVTTKRFLFTHSDFDPHAICVFDIKSALETTQTPSVGNSVGFMYKLSAHEAVSHPSRLNKLAMTPCGLGLMAVFSSSVQCDGAGESESGGAYQVVLWNFEGGDLRRPLCAQVLSISRSSAMNASSSSTSVVGLNQSDGRDDVIGWSWKQVASLAADGTVMQVKDVVLTLTQ